VGVEVLPRTTRCGRRPSFGANLLDFAYKPASKALGGATNGRTNPEYRRLP
jgi:hypothetical protein